MPKHKKTKPTSEARAARDALLRRAQWIVDSNIRAACGLQPILPPDLVDFTNHEPGQPSIASLNGLLKSVMPAINLEDDRTHSQVISGENAEERATSILDSLVAGRMSLAEADRSMVLIKSGMEISDRTGLMQFVADYSAKHDIQLKSF